MEETDNKIVSNIFDASLNLGSVMVNQAAEVSREDLVDELVPKVQAIINRTFPDVPQKRVLKVYKDRISFACPICRDSAHNMSKKRGTLILEGKFKNLYKCHNCGVCMSTYRFLRTYGENLSNKAIDYMVSHRGEMVRQDSSAMVTNMLFDTDIIDEYAVDREYFKKRCNLVECAGTYAGQYLRGRNQYKEEKFLYNPIRNLLFVLNLTPSGKILGLQMRSLDRRTASKYMTYKLSNVYSMLMHEDREIPEEIENISVLFNILLVRYDIPVTVVEGPMDSFFLTNCIATCGASHNMKFDMHIRYLFDDDKTGREHAMEKLNEGYEVFLWDKLKTDLHMPWKKKWDVNDMVNWAVENRVRLPRLDGYFTNDKLNLLSL